MLTEAPFLVGLGVAAPLPVLLAAIALVRREPRAVRRDLLVLFGAGAGAVNLVWLAVSVAVPDSGDPLWPWFTGAVGFCAACCAAGLARALLTPHREYAVFLAMIVSGSVAVPLAYYGWLFMPLSAVPGASLAAVLGAWNCHRIAGDLDGSPCLGFVFGSFAGAVTTVLTVIPAAILTGAPVLALRYLGEYAF